MGEETDQDPISDHDQRFKKAIRENFRDLVHMFFPRYANLFVFESIEWVNTEVFLGEPTGKRFFLDTVAKVKTTRPIDPKQPDLLEGFALVLNEIESPTSSMRIDDRIIWYFLLLRFKYEMPILPVVLFLNMRKDGIGQQVLEIPFYDTEVLKFTYQYVALAGLDPLEYLKKDYPIGWALTSLMKEGKRDAYEVAKQAVGLINKANIRDTNRSILIDVLESYLDIPEERREEILKMIKLSPPEKLVPLNETTLAKQFKQKHLEGAVESLQSTLIRIITKRIDETSAKALTPEIEAITDAEKLNAAIDMAISTTSLDEIRKALA